MKKYFGIVLFSLFAFCFEVQAQQANLYIGEAAIAEAIIEEFANEGMENVEVDLFGGRTSYAIEDANSSKLLVSGLKLDELNSKFTVSIEIFADGKFVAKTDIQGKYYQMVQAYVPAQNINRGDIIEEEDLKQISARGSRIKPEYVIEPAKLIGYEAKKPLKEGRFITGREIGKPSIIKKGSNVNMLYKSGGIEISVRGEALSDGAKGDKIELLNTKSKKSVFGIVLDADNVEIEAQ